MNIFNSHPERESPSGYSALRSVQISQIAYNRRPMPKKIRPQSPIGPACLRSKKRSESLRKRRKRKKKNQSSGRFHPHPLSLYSRPLRPRYTLDSTLYTFLPLSDPRHVFAFSPFHTSTFGVVCSLQFVVAVAIVVTVTVADDRCELT